jgi:uncharacterized protein YdeI (YjbR/CyaY-like superfamily)
MGAEQALRLKRPRYEMPDSIRDALLEHRLMEACRSRPPYQQYDYIGWIAHAKRRATKDKRLAQMLTELSRGDTNRNMDFRPRQRR